MAVVTFGERNQGLADRFLAAVSLRFLFLMSIFKDGWRSYLGSILRTFGVLSQPRRKGKMVESFTRV